MAITQEDMKKLSPSELCSHLIDALGDRISGSVLDSLEEQRVSGASFLNLRDEDLYEVASHLGDRVTLRSYIDGFKISTKVHVHALLKVDNLEFPTIQFLTCFETKMVTSSQCLDPDSPTHMTVCMGRSCYVHVMLASHSGVDI